MPLIKDIETQLVQAMKAKDVTRLNALRNMKAAFMSEVIALKKQELSDEEELVVIKRLVKQRKDSAEQFRKGSREELAQAEEAESNILEAYLPQSMNEEEIRKIAEAVKVKLGITDKSKMGPLMGAVMKEAKGRADGTTVKRVVEGLFE